MGDFDRFCRNGARAKKGYLLLQLCLTTATYVILYLLPTLEAIIIATTNQPSFVFHHHSSRKSSFDRFEGRKKKKFVFEKKTVHKCRQNMNEEYLKKRKEEIIAELSERWLHYIIDN